MFEDMVEVKVKLFGPAAELVGQDELDYGLARPGRLDNLVMMIRACYPQLNQWGDTLRFAVNGQFSQGDQELNPGDEVAVIPPVSGG